MEKQKSTQITSSEKQALRLMGSRWSKMADNQVLSESALLFRLAVAIIGERGRVSGTKKGG